MMEFTAAFKVALGSSELQSLCLSFTALAEGASLDG